MASTPGQAAYEKWCEQYNTPPKKLNKPLPIQPWEKLLPQVKSLWEAVAQAAIDADRRRAS